MGDDFHVFSTLKHWEGALIREGVLIRDNTLPDLSYICLSVVNLGIAVGQGMGPRGETCITTNSQLMHKYITNKRCLALPILCAVVFSTIYILVKYWVCRVLISTDILFSRA